MSERMKTKIRARKRTVLSWIEQKFGSLEMLASIAGIDTSIPEVRTLLKQIRTSREPVVLRIQWRSAVIEVAIEHHESAITHESPGFIAASIKKEDIAE